LHGLGCWGLFALYRGQTADLRQRWFHWPVPTTAVTAAKQSK
jgi:hypothetical protein